MTAFGEFKVVLEQLVAKVQRVEDELKSVAPGKAGRGKPEETTRAKLLVRTQPEDYMSIGDSQPKRKLPELSNNFVIADSLDVSFDIDAWLGLEAQQRIVLGNSPWGAMVTTSKTSLNSYSLAKGQYDSYDLFIERVTHILRPGDAFGYIVPDSMLQLPQHTLLRKLILDNYQIDDLIKLGEGVFEDVFRAAVAFIFTRTEKPPVGHTLRSRIIVKTEREQLLKVSRNNAIQELLDRNGSSISQDRFKQNAEKEFAIFASDEDATILEAIKSGAMDWDETTVSARGVELSKNGLVMACPHCGTWQPIPERQKNGMYQAIFCKNPACKQTIRYENSPHATIITSAPTIQCTQPIIVGEGLNRYQIVETRFIDTTKVRAFPCCPNPKQGDPKRICSFCDVASPPFVPGEIRICQRCGQQYTGAEVKNWAYRGIDYKSPDWYNDEKLLVRKTGRGIYATIDRTGAYTVQSIYIFKLHPDRTEQHEKLRLSYILGVLNSRMMLYRYYKALGDIEWKSFPYMTQRTIKSLPIRTIDFTDVRQTYFHNSIADSVDAVITSGKPPDMAMDTKIERLVRELYGVNTPVANARIDAELERISQFGSLLGSSTEE